MFTYCGNNSVNNCDPLGNRYCIFSPVPDARAEDKSTANQGQSKKSNTSLRDVTDEILNALHIYAGLAHMSNISSFINYQNEYGCIGILFSSLENYVRFYKLEDHYATWDIKEEGPWVQTIGTPYPGKETSVVFNGNVMTPEMIGNFTYGYLGYHHGFPIDILYVGSYWAAGCPIWGHALSEEIWDWQYIQTGYWYAESE